MPLRTIISVSSTLFIVTVFAWNCDGSTTVTNQVFQDYDQKRVPYKFYAPDESFQLRGDLEEVSGLAITASGHLAAVQDEDGLLYMLNSANGEVLRTIKFAGPGDYEAVEVVNGTAHVMTSNGALYSFKISEEDEVQPQYKETPFSEKNNIEGLGTDGKDLLIACKGEGEVSQNNIRGKAVYRYNLKKDMLEDLIFSFSKKALNDHIQGREFYHKVDDFKPSGIAVHPLTGDVYVLSSANLLIVQANNIIAVVKLNNAIYTQPEGICFAPDGTLFIASEGDNGRGEIFRLFLKA